MTEEFSTDRVGPDGKMEPHIERIDTPLFPLEGYKALNPNRKPIASTLKEMQAALGGCHTIPRKR